MTELKPIDILLFCPRCEKQHVDAPEPETGWDNPPHRSHKCRFCNAVWRPSDSPTNGVARIKTRGAADNVFFNCNYESPISEAEAHYE